MAARPASDAPPVSWRARQPFATERIRAVAIYCSDGRWGQQFDEFLHDSLRLPRYDRLAIPGGAAALAGHIASWREADALQDQLRFLVEVHGLERVVLIAHHQCAYYTQKLHVAAANLREQQEADLAKAVESIRAISTRLDIDAYFAELDAGVVTMRLAAP